MKTILKWFKRVFLCYLAYVLIFALLIYYIPKPMSTTIDTSTYTKNGIGPDRIALVEYPKDAFSRRIELIRSAKKNLDVCYHNIKKGQTADCFIGELLLAADRGVHVRLLLDGALGGLQGEHEDLKIALLAHPNVELRGYNPIHFLKPWDFHVRLHDKFIIADTNKMMLGGRNIGDEYFAPPYYEDKITNDRDVVIINAKHSKDSVIYDVKDYMEELWTNPKTEDTKLSQTKIKEGKTIQKDLKALCHKWEQEYEDYYLPKKTVESIAVSTNQVSLLHNPLDGYKKEPVLGATIAQLLKDCKQVMIQTPYATANKHTLQQLSEIAKDADVQLLTNSMASTPNYPAFSNYISQREKFIDTGIEIYEYQSLDSIHGKSCIADDHIAVVGSFNLDDRSLYIDTESVVVIDSEPFYEELESEMHLLKNQSAQVDKDNTYVDNAQNVLEVSSAKNILMHIVSFFSRMFQCLI